MVERLKRWESPRRQGRNDKGKGGSARQRQLQKRQQMLRQKLQNKPQKGDGNQLGGDLNQGLFLFLNYLCLNHIKTRSPFVQSALIGWSSLS